MQNARTRVKVMRVRVTKKKRSRSRMKRMITMRIKHQVPSSSMNHQVLIRVKPNPTKNTLNCTK